MPLPGQILSGGAEVGGTLATTIVVIQVGNANAFNFQFVSGTGPVFVTVYEREEIGSLKTGDAAPTGRGSRYVPGDSEIRTRPGGGLGIYFIVAWGTVGDEVVRFEGRP